MPISTQYESLWVRSAGLRHVAFWSGVIVLFISCVYGLRILWLLDYKKTAIALGVLLFPPMIYVNLRAIHHNAAQAINSLGPILDESGHSAIAKEILPEIGIALQKTQIDDQLTVKAERAWIRTTDEYGIMWGSYLVKGSAFSSSVFAIAVFHNDFAVPVVAQYRVPLIRRLFDSTPISLEHDYKIKSRDTTADARDWIARAPQSVIDEFIELRDFNWEFKGNMLCMFYDDGPREAFGFSPIKNDTERHAYWTDRVQRVDRLAKRLLENERYFFDPGV
jgi:hypothetical protein